MLYRVAQKTYWDLNSTNFIIINIVGLKLKKMSFTGKTVAINLQTIN